MWLCECVCSCVVGDWEGQFWASVAKQTHCDGHNMCDQSSLKGSYCEAGSFVGLWWAWVVFVREEVVEVIEVEEEEAPPKQLLVPQKSCESHNIICVCVCMLIRFLIGRMK